MHVIAGKAVAFGEALQPEFKTYIDNGRELRRHGGKAHAGGLRLFLAVRTIICA